MVRRLLFGLVFALSGIISYAQNTVKGRVVDAATLSPEPGAVVQLFSSSADNENMLAYALSDSVGVFSIKFKSILPDTDYIIQVVNMGRKTEQRTFRPSQGATDLGTIALEDDVQALKSSKITAAKPLIKMDADKIAYDVENDVDSKASTVLDMLRKVPMVTVDGQDNITVNGSSSFKVYVDGKPNQMLSSNPSKIFKAMPASSIKGIEVITNPGAKYDAEGTGGVLNLISAKSENGTSAIPDGANGSVDIGVDTRGSIDGGLFINAKKGKLTVGADVYAGRDQNRDITNIVTQYAKAEDMTLVTSANVPEQPVRYLFGSLNASYEKDSLNLFSASIGTESFGYHYNAAGTNEASIAGSPLYNYRGKQYLSGSNAGINASFDWQHSFAGNKEKMFTLSYRFSNTPEKSFSETSYDNVSGITLYNRKVDGTNISQEHTFQLDYTTPIAKGQTLSSGAKYIFRNNYADDAYYLDKGAGYSLESDDQGYHHYNNIAAAYSEYAGSFGKFSLKAGLRYEHTWVKVSYADGTGYNTGYDNLVPNFSLQYNVGQTSNLGLTYNMRISRPGISYLNPFVNRSSENSISYGDPDIQPEKTHSFAVKYNFFSPKIMLNAGLSYRFGEGGIESFSKYAADPDDASRMILHNTYGNIVSNRTLGTNAFINWNPAKDTRIYSSINLGYNIISSDILGQGNRGWNGHFMVGGQQTIFWDLRLSANFFGNTRRYSLQGWSSGFSGASLGLTKGFFDDKFNVTLRGFSNLGGARVEFKSHTEGAGFTMDSFTSLPIRCVGIELSYSFGKNNFQVKKASHSISNDDVVNAQNAVQQQNSQASMK